jgi:hypothetical protein
MQVVDLLQQLPTEAARKSIGSLVVISASITVPYVYPTSVQVVRAVVPRPARA